MNIIISYMYAKTDRRKHVGSQITQLFHIKMKKKTKQTYNTEKMKLIESHLLKYM